VFGREFSGSGFRATVSPIGKVLREKPTYEKN
jgi:hypothetical protein